MIPYKSLLTDIKDIEARNIAFNALTKIKQRKEICLDAIALVLSGQVDASNGVYWSQSLVSIRDCTPLQFQKILVDDLPQCDVCQRGLLMVSQIRLSNTVSSDDFSRDSGNTRNIKGFSLLNFKKMEEAYENFTMKQFSAKESQPYKFNTWEKLVNICCNVIANGNFKVNDTTDYLKLWELSRSETFAS